MTIERSESIKELATALAKAQAALKPAVKDALNPHFDKKYADLSAVWEACREPLSSNGLSVVQMPANAEAGRLALTTFLLHASGEWMSSTFSIKLQQDTAHGAGSALTYLRRYALAALVGVVADEDDDGNSASQQAQPQRQPTRNAPQQRPSQNGALVRGARAADSTASASYEPPPEQTTRAEVTPAEAEQRFFARYAEIVGGNNWSDVLRYLGSRAAKPTTKEGWVAAADAVRAKRCERMIDKIADLSARSMELNLNIHLEKPLDEMTEEELIAHGKKLAQAITEAEARVLAPIAA